MISYCPTCSNMLMLDGQIPPRLVCESCPYMYTIRQSIYQEAVLKRKEVDAVHDEASANTSRAKTEAPCPKCDHRVAFFEERQTRSADEAATIFFECAKCKHKWKEG
eukprot:jgi/Botrbrau1/13170/Bobra.242_1s0007.1